MLRTCHKRHFVHLYLYLARGFKLKLSIVVPQDEDVYNERARIQNMSSDAIGAQSVVLKDLTKVRKQVLESIKVEAGPSC